MTTIVGRMAIELGMDASGLEKGLAQVESRLQSAGQKMGAIGGAMTAKITMPMIEMAGSVTKLSNDLNAGMANIASLGVATDTIKGMKKEIQNLSIATGKSTDDLAEGAYQVVSAFGDTADSMKILRTNAKLAKSGLATTAEAIALTSAVTKGYGDVNADAVAHVADLASATVALGQTTMPEVASAIGLVTPLSAQLGVSMEDLFAVMATGSGVTGTTSQVATQFRGILQSLLAPTASMTKLFTKMGYENGEAMLKGEGLLGTIKAITGAVGKDEAITDYIGSIEGVNLALSLADKQSETYTKNQKALMDATGMADEAFRAQTEGVNATGFGMEQLQRKVEVLGQRIGDALAPGIAVILDKLTPFADKIIELSEAFTTLSPEVQSWIVAGLGIVAALGPLLMILPGIVSGVTALAGACAALSGPLAVAGVAVAILGYLWFTNFGGIQEKTAEMWKTVGPILEDMGGRLAAIVSADVAKGIEATSAAIASFATKLQEFSGEKAPEALKILAALMTSGGGDASVKVAFDMSGLGDTGFTWDGGLLKFDAQGKLKAFNMEGFFGETTGFSWDAANGFTMTVNGKVAFNSAEFSETLANLGKNLEGGENQLTVNVDIMGAFSKSFWDLMTASAALLTDIFSDIQISGKWAAGEIEARATELVDYFAGPNAIISIYNQWASDQILHLWQKLQEGLREPIRVFAEWGANVFGGLWQAIQDFFSGKTIKLAAAASLPAGTAMQNVPGVGKLPLPGGTGGGAGSTTGGGGFHAAGGLARGWSVVGEKGPEFAFFGGAGADILSNANSINLLSQMGMPLSSGVPGLRGSSFPGAGLPGESGGTGAGGGSLVSIGTVNVRSDQDIQTLAYQVAGYLSRRRD